MTRRNASLVAMCCILIRIASLPSLAQDVPQHDASSALPVPNAPKTATSSEAAPDVPREESEDSSSETNEASPTRNSSRPTVIRASIWKDGRHFDALRRHRPPSPHYAQRGSRRDRCLSSQSRPEHRDQLWNRDEILIDRVINNNQYHSRGSAAERLQGPDKTSLKVAQIEE